MTSDYNNEDFVKLLNFVKTLSKPDESPERLQELVDLTPENSYGNYDDCFYDGMASKGASIAQDARDLLKNIETGLQNAEDKKNLREKVVKL